jgi:hypothetical protein
MNYGSEFRNYIQKSKIHELRNFHSKGRNRVICEYVERLQANSNQVYDDLCEKTETFLYNLVRYITGSCKFTLMVTDQFLDAHRIFCNLNLSGEPLSPLDLYRARFYGQMVNEKGLKEANRSVDTKLKIWNKIHAELGNKEMSCFLSHVCRIKLAERNDLDKFIASFSYKEEQILNFLGECTDNLHLSEEFYKQVEALLDVWNNIFYMKETNSSKEALKLLRLNHYEIWLTIALIAGYNNVLLNREFWAKLEKYISIMLVNLSSRFHCSYSETNEVLNRCYKDIQWIIEWKEFSVNLDQIEISEFSQYIKGDVYTKLSDYALVYLIMRIGLDKKSELQKIYQNIDKVTIDLICSQDENLSPIEWINEGLPKYSGYLGNLILIDGSSVDKFRNKTWAEKKENINLAKLYSLTMTVLNQESWDLARFKQCQDYYVNLIGKFYDIEELKVYKFSVLSQSRKRKFNEVNDEEIMVVVPESNEPVPKRQDIEIRKTPVTKIDDFYIYLDANDLNNHLRNTERISCESIRSVLRRIDPDGIGYADDDVVLRLLLRLQKQYKIYARKWQSTFKKWIREANTENKGCFYAGIFISNNNYTNYRVDN